MGLIFFRLFQNNNNKKDLDVQKRTTRIICFGLFGVELNLHTLIRR